MTPPLRSVSLLIPQRNQVDLTLNLMASLARHEPRNDPVLIVDDGSDPAELDRTLEAVDARTRVLSIPQSGVTAAWNAGLDHVSTECVILMNNDVVVHGSWIDELLAPLAQGEALVSAPASRFEPLAPNAAHPIPQGWCFAARTDLVNALGRFDPRFELYYSDADFCVRVLDHAAAMGHPSPFAFVERLPLSHLGHRSTRHLSTRRSLHEHDRIHFVEKHHAAALP